jgi:GDP-4-dehydro-6-deoxy-D-mannose reductase
MVELASHGSPGLVYHVGTGQSQRVGDALERLIELSGRSVRISVDPALANRRGPADSRAEIARITAHTTWRAEIPWEKSLIDLWNAARDLERMERPGESAAA